jgi:hypothetical protein
MRSLFQEETIGTKPKNEKKKRQKRKIWSTKGMHTLPNHLEAHPCCDRFSSLAFLRFSVSYMNEHNLNNYRENNSSYNLFRIGQFSP